MPYNSKNIRHIEKILCTSVDNSFLQMPLKFQVDRIKIVRVLPLSELKNTVMRKTRLKMFGAESRNFQHKLFLGTKPSAVYF